MTVEAKMKQDLANVGKDTGRSSPREIAIGQSLEPDESSGRSRRQRLAFTDDRLLTRQRGSGIDSSKQIVRLNQTRNNQLTQLNQNQKEHLTLTQELLIEVRQSNNQRLVSI